MYRHPVFASALSYLALGALFLFFAYSLTLDIDRPWVDQIDFNGAVWSQAAHNILRAGLLETQGASTAFYFGPLPIPNAGYYLHHPPLLHLGIAGLFAMLGEHEWVARLVPIFCTLCSFVLLWLLVRETLGRRTALFCMAVFASLPMALRYGTMVNFEPVVLTLILSALYGLRHWELTGRRRWKALFFASLFLGLWVDWAMHLFALTLFAWWMTRPGRPARRLAWTVLTVTGVCSLLYLTHMQILRPDALEDLHKTFLVRVASDAKYKFTFWQWTAKVSSSIVRHFLWGGLAAAAIGAVIAWRRRSDPGMAWIGWASTMIFAMDAVFVGVFQNDSYIHEYIPFYFIVPVAVMAGIALNELLETAEKAPLRGAHAAASVAAVLLVAGGMWMGQARTSALQGRFCILDLHKKESEALIPAVGKIIRSHFSPATRVLCNFMPYYGPQLEYYAHRTVAANLGNPGDWRPYIQKTEGDVGGIVWMGDADAQEILAKLPPGRKEFVRLENENFCLWRPADFDGKP